MKKTFKKMTSKIKFKFLTKWVAHGPRPAGTISPWTYGPCQATSFLAWVGSASHDFEVGHASLACWPIIAWSTSGSAGRPNFPFKFLFCKVKCL